MSDITKKRSLLVKLGDQYGMDPVAFAEAVKRTVFPGGNATNEQLAAFLVVANSYGLNPFTKQIFAFPSKGGGITPMVSLDGWAAIINSRPEFDGMEFSDQTDNGKLVSVTCRIFRKDRSHPTEVTEYMEECARATEPWQKWPARMLRHKAMIQCARYAFSLTGIFDPDEAQRIREAEAGREVPVITRKSEPVTTPAEPAPGLLLTEADIFDPKQEMFAEQHEAAATAPEPEKITAKQRSRLFAVAKAAGADADGVKAYLKANYGLEHTSDILKSDYDAICGFFEGLARE